MRTLYFITLFISILLSIFVVIREKKGIHHWLHYTPFAIAGNSFIYLLDTVLIPKYQINPIVSGILYLLPTILILISANWIYENGKRIKK